MILIFKHVAAILAGMFLAGVIAWIAIQCFNDTRSIFHEMRADRKNKKPTVTRARQRSADEKHLYLL